MAASARSFWSRALDVASLAATPLAPSHYLELVSPLFAAHARQARVEAVQDESPTARTLTLRPGRWGGHRAGQFVSVGSAIDGRIVTRTYSISSSPERRDGCLTVTVKAVPGGKMSGHLARATKPGDYVTLGEAQGDFVLPEALPARVLLLTGGSGITPVMSMLRTLAARRTMPDVVHVHFAPSRDEVLFDAELARIEAEHPRYRRVVVTTRQGEARRARLNVQSLDAFAPDWRHREAWACGPAGMLEAAESIIASARRAEALRIERFRPKLAPAVQGGGGRVRFGLSRREVEASGSAPLLEVAERSGVSAPHGCRMGICHTCDASLVSGCVRDLRTGKTIDEPGARVQVCVCAAAGDVEIAL